MKRIHYNANAGKEPYLLYEAPFMASYMMRMREFILPSDLDTLFKHFDSFATFIDSLTEFIFDRQERRERLIEEHAPSIVRKNNIPKPMSKRDKRIREWYDNSSSSSEDSTVDIIVEEEEEEEDRPSGIGLNMLGEQQQQQRVHHLMIDEEMEVNMGQLTNIALEWHMDVVARDNVLTSRYANCYFLSWGCFCRIFYLTIYDDPIKYTLFTESTAARHPYCLANASCKLVVTPVSMENYSLRNLWATMRPLVDTLYTVQFSPVMKEYLHILFFRYCQFMSIDCSPAGDNGNDIRVDGDEDDDEEEEEEDEDEIYDDPSFASYGNTRQIQKRLEKGDYGDDEEHVDEEEDGFEITEEPFAAYKDLKIQVHPKYAITSKFVYEGELIFYNQLTRINLSTKLMNQYRSSPAYTEASRRGPLAYTQRLTSCMEAWFDMANALVVDPELTGSINELFKSQMIHIYMYHGEKERFTREFPESSNDSSDVISKIRRNDYLRISEIRQITLATLINIYHTGLEEVSRLMDQKNNSATTTTTLPNEFVYPQIIYDREMTLVTYICTTEWMRYVRWKLSESVQDYFIVEDLKLIGDVLLAYARRNTVSVVASRTKEQNKSPRIPYLIKLVQVYYVVDMEAKGSGIYATHFMVEAYMVWLKLLYKQKHLPNRMLHKTIVECITNL